MRYQILFHGICEPQFDGVAVASWIVATEDGRVIHRESEVLTTLERANRTHNRLTFIAARRALEWAHANLCNVVGSERPTSFVMLSNNEVVCMNMRGHNHKSVLYDFNQSCHRLITRIRRDTGHPVVVIWQPLPSSQVPDVLQMTRDTLRENAGVQLSDEQIENPFGHRPPANRPQRRGFRYADHGSRIRPAAPVPANNIDDEDDEELDAAYEAAARQARGEGEYGDEEPERDTLCDWSAEDYVDDSEPGLSPEAREKLSADLAAFSARLARSKQQVAPSEQCQRRVIQRED